MARTGWTRPGPDWLHEIKFDGYRLRVERNGDRVKLITRVAVFTAFRCASSQLA
jgi:hypothetical protein